MAPDIQTKLLSTDDIDDLIYACRTGDLEWLQDLLKTHSQKLDLSEAEIITNAIDIDNDGLGSRACLLHYPAANGNLEIVQFLLERLDQASNMAKKLCNQQNVNGNTPLHWAALNGHVEIVKALVKAGADPTVVNEAGRDAVVEAEYSSKEGAADCAHWLLKECDVLERGAGAGVGGHDENGEGQEVAVGEQEQDEGQRGMQMDGKDETTTNGISENHDNSKDHT